MAETRSWHSLVSVVGMLVTNPNDAATAEDVHARVCLAWVSDATEVAVVLPKNYIGQRYQAEQRRVTETTTGKRPAIAAEIASRDVCFIMIRCPRPAELDSRGRGEQNTAE